MSILSRFVTLQIKLSHAFDRLLPPAYRVDGNEDFLQMIWGHIRPSDTVWDVGGGKHPVVSTDRKVAMGLHVVGVDIDGEQVAMAPPGLYDDTVVADIQRLRGPGNADVVVCQALLEHVANIEDALTSIRTILRPGGAALIFVPSRTALFARLNKLLPEAVKRKLLFNIFPASEAIGGFPAYYDRCSPAELTVVAGRCGLDVIEKRVYFKSGYFSFFAPAYVAWRCWLLGYRFLAGDQAAETMSFAFVKARPMQDHSIGPREDSCVA